MLNLTAKCAKCGAESRSGFIPDFGHGVCHVSSWHEGEPQKSFWTITKVARGSGIPIRAYRCTRCGLLEFYAPDAPR